MPATPDATALSSVGTQSGDRYSTSSGTTSTVFCTARAQKPGFVGGARYRPGMPLPTAAWLDTIGRHSAGFADSAGPPGATVATPPPVLAAPAADLLLWLYGRVEIDTAAVPTELLAAFRALTDTD